MSSSETAHYFRCEWVDRLVPHRKLAQSPSSGTSVLVLSVSLLFSVRFIYFIGSRESLPRAIGFSRCLSAPPHLQHHLSLRFSRWSVFTGQVALLSLVLLSVCQMRLVVDWVSSGTASSSAVPVSLWEADSASCSTRCSRPLSSSSKEGRKSCSSRVCVSFPVCCKTALLCNSLGLLNWFRGRWEVRLESLEIQPVILGGPGPAGKVVRVGLEVERGREKEERGVLSCARTDSSLRLLATTGLT